MFVFTPQYDEDVNLNILYFHLPQQKCDNMHQLTISRHYNVGSGLTVDGLLLGNIRKREF